MKQIDNINLNESYVKKHKDGILIHLHVHANAKHTKIEGKYGDCLKIKVAAPKDKGKANEEIIRFFAELFNIHKNDVKITKGVLSQNKILYIKIS